MSIPTAFPITTVTPAQVETVRQVIRARIARRAYDPATVAQVWNWHEFREVPVPAVAVERAIRGLIADGTVAETALMGNLAFRTI